MIIMENDIFQANIKIKINFIIILFKFMVLLSYFLILKQDFFQIILVTSFA